MTIEIIVMPTGKTTVQTKGFAGASCREASKFIEQALGRQTGEHLTAEFHQSAAAKQTQRLREQPELLFTETCPAPS